MFQSGMAGGHRAPDDALNPPLAGSRARISERRPEFNGAGQAMGTARHGAGDALPEPLFARGDRIGLGSLGRSASTASWPGIVPAIHALPCGTKSVDARDKPGHAVGLNPFDSAGESPAHRSRLTPEVLLALY